MPELPEVETIRRGLQRRLVGAHLEAVAVRDRRLREPVSETDLGELVGARIDSFGRRAKYLLVGTDADRTLVLHLGMSGRIVVADRRQAYNAHDHVVLGLRDADGAEVEVRLQDPRRFGLALVVPNAELPSHRLFAHLGPEPLGDEFSEDYFVGRARGRSAPVKNFVMDARVVVGVGNIYASESLWRAGVHPSRSAGRIAAVRLARLHRAIRSVLGDAIAAGGTTLRDYRDSDGNLGYFAADLSVYDRAGAECARCGDRIRRIVQGARATYYCAGCQR